MRVEPLSIEGAFVVTPRQHRDDRGVFLESFRGDVLAEHLGHRPDVVQSNVSVSSRGTVRGIHVSNVPPGQAKYVSCVAGAVLDLVVDLRVGSPTYGTVDAVWASRLGASQVSYLGYAQRLLVAVANDALAVARPTAGACPQRPPACPPSCARREPMRCGRWGRMRKPLNAIDRAKKIVARSLIFRLQ